MYQSLLSVSRWHLTRLFDLSGRICGLSLLSVARWHLTWLFDLNGYFAFPGAVQRSMLSVHDGIRLGCSISMATSSCTIVDAVRSQWHWRGCSISMAVQHDIDGKRHDCSISMVSRQLTESGCSYSMAVHEHKFSDLDCSHSAVSTRLFAPNGRLVNAS